MGHGGTGLGLAAGLDLAVQGGSRWYRSRFSCYKVGQGGTGLGLDKIYKLNLNRTEFRVSIL